MTILCMNCKRAKATVTEGRAEWCQECFAFVVGLAEHPVVLGSSKREKSRDIDYRSRYAPGGSWDHSER